MGTLTGFAASIGVFSSTSSLMNPASVFYSGARAGPEKGRSDLFGPFFPSVCHPGMSVPWCLSIHLCENCVCHFEFESTPAIWRLLVPAGGDLDDVMKW